MKKLNILLAILLFFTVNIFAVNSEKQIKRQNLNEKLATYEKAYSAENIEDFLDLTPKKIREETGNKLSLKEILILKAAQKRIKKASSNLNDESKPKSQVAALIIVIFVGVLGIHRFYLGYTGIGIIQLLTLGGCGIWALIDLIMIATGDLKPKDGSNYDPTL